MKVFNCRANWTGSIIAYTPKIYTGNDIDTYNIFNDGIVFANVSYIKTLANTQGVQGWC